MSWDYDPFAEREQPPMSAELFTTLVTARLRPIEQVEVESAKALELKLRVRGIPMTAPLEHYYQIYLENPRILTPLVNDLISALKRGEPPLPKEKDAFTTIAPSLFPLLMSAGEWQQKHTDGLRLVIRPLVQELGIALVRDHGSEIEYVQLDAIPHWGVDAEAAYETANINLDQGAIAIPVSEYDRGNAKLLIDNFGDGYAATRVILPSRLDDWARRIEGELVLGLPSRDFLIGFSRNHPNFNQLRTQIIKDALEDVRGLLAELLIYREGVLEILD